MSPIRPAVPADLNALIAIDLLAQTDPGRKMYLEKSISSGECLLYEKDGKVLGFAIYNYSFYDQGFISLVVVRDDQRCQGIGASLIQAIEQRCRTEKIFTSTNLSNTPMQIVLARGGYTLSGVIHHLDEGDPELVYVKFLRTSPKNQ